MIRKRRFKISSLAAMCAAVLLLATEVYAGNYVKARSDIVDTAVQAGNFTTLAAALEAGYAWAYERLFSDASIWRRRPWDLRAVLPYLAMSYLYKHSNRLWAFLIRHRLTSTAWHPLVEWTRRRHVRFRRRLAGANLTVPQQAEPSVLPPGV